MALRTWRSRLHRLTWGRLASNSLLEAVVLAHNAADWRILTHLNPQRSRSLGERQCLHQMNKWYAHNLEELKRTLWDYVGIVRTTNA